MRVLLASLWHYAGRWHNGDIMVTMWYVDLHVASNIHSKGSFNTMLLSDHTPKNTRSTRSKTCHKPKHRIFTDWFCIFCLKFVLIFFHTRLWKMLDIFFRKNVPAKRGPTKHEQQQMSIRSMHPKIGVFQTIFYNFLSLRYLKIWNYDFRFEKSDL